MQTVVHFSKVGKAAAADQVPKKTVEYWERENRRFRPAKAFEI